MGITHLNLESVFNCGLNDTDAGGDLNLKEVFRNLKQRSFKAGGIELSILPTGDEVGRNALLLSGGAAKSAIVEAGRKFGGLCLLHSVTGSAMLELVYSDGNRAEVKMEDGVHYAGSLLEGGYFAESAMPFTIRDESILEKEASLYLAEVRNPNPRKAVSSIVFHCDGRQDSRWVLFAAATWSGRGRILPDWRDFKVAVDASKPVGGIRRLHGTNLGPTMKGKDVSPELTALEIPIVRFHDAPLANPGLDLVDISEVFPIFSADHMDPGNYKFKQTDDYIADCLATGAKISYRLGESIEWTRDRHYKIHPPEDYEKWAEICCQIIAHYNEGWADGFHHGIEYWPIWEEPDNTPHLHDGALWTGTWSDYIRLYVVTAKKIKSRFPNVKVGGPTLWGICRQSLANEFLSECRKQQAPLDFFAWNCYGTHPSKLMQEPAIARKLLDDHGFTNTETQIAEWNYTPFGLFDTNLDARMPAFKGMTGVDGAAYVCATLSGLQDTSIDMANYYVGSVMGYWGLFEQYCRMPYKTYYAFKAFNTMTKYATRLAVDCPQDKNIWVLAGRKDNGDIAVMVSCFKVGTRSIKLDFGNSLDLSGMKMNALAIDEGRSLEPCDEVSVNDGKVLIDKPEGSAVYLVEFGAHS